MDTGKYLHAILGVDVVAIPGISEISAPEILSETGTDLSKWPSRNHFVSRLNLCPNNKISGGKLISSQMLRKNPTQRHRPSGLRQIPCAGQSPGSGTISGG
jgi:hypothetical protein